MNCGERVDHAGNSTDCVHGIKADDCLRHVRHADCDYITFLDSDSPECFFGLLDLRDKLCKCGVFVLECQCDLFRILACALKEGIAH